MIKIKNCENCKNIKEIQNGTNFCNSCDYFLGHFINLYKYFYFIIVCLHYYPEKEIREIVNNLIKLNKLIKNGIINEYNFNDSYNDILYKINIIKYKNNKIKKQHLHPKTQTFLMLIYK